MSEKRKNMKLLKPKIDVVFQSLFSKKNEKITKAFAEAILDEKVRKITINDDKELFRERPEDKLGILDLELDINDSEKVDVEIQLVDRSRDLVLTDKVEIAIIELSKVRAEYEKNKNNKKAQWALFINDPNTKEVEEIMKENKDIEEAIVTVHKMTEDEKMRRLADLREKAIMDEKAIRRKGYEDGHALGHEAGLKEGHESEKINIAKKLKSKRVSIEEIAEITGLEEEKIKKL